MTIKEFYEWAVEHELEDYEIRCDDIDSEEVYPPLDPYRLSWLPIVWQVNMCMEDDPLFKVKRIDNDN